MPLHGLLEHKHLLDHTLTTLTTTFLHPDRPLSINWSAVFSYSLYTAVFAVVYPLSYAAHVALTVLWWAVVLVGVLLRSVLGAVVWPVSWLGVFEPLYIYLTFAILLGVLVGAILYATSEAILYVLAQISIYFGTPTFRGELDEHGHSLDSNTPSHAEQDQDEKQDDKDSWLRTWIKDGAVEAQKMVRWKTPAARELALFHPRRIEEEDRDEPNYDTEVEGEGEAGVEAESRAVIKEEDEEPEPEAVVS